MVREYILYVKRKKVLHGIVILAQNEMLMKDFDMTYQDLMTRIHDEIEFYQNAIHTLKQVMYMHRIKKTRQDNMMCRMNTE